MTPAPIPFLHQGREEKTVKGRKNKALPDAYPAIGAFRVLL